MNVEDAWTVYKLAAGLFATHGKPGGASIDDCAAAAVDAYAAASAVESQYDTLLLRVGMLCGEVLTRLRNG